jgi:hypothetical protein
MADLLPNKKQFKRLLIPVGIMYLAMGILLRPDWYPGLLGHIMIWLLYGVSFYLLNKSQQGTVLTPDDTEIETWQLKQWILLAGIFPLAAVAGEILTSPFSDLMALIFWFGGIAFGLFTFIKAVRLTFPKGEAGQHV